MNNDFAAATRFLTDAGLTGPQAFAFVNSDAPDDYELFERTTFEVLAQLVVPKQGDGHVLYVRVSGEAYLPVAGLLDMSRKPPAPYDVEQMLKLVADTKTTGMGAWAIPKEGAAGTTEIKLPLAPHHKQYLQLRGLTEDTIEASGVGSITDKKAISKLLGRSTWGSGSALSFPHRYDPGADQAAQRLYLDSPSNASHQSLWVNAKPAPYFPEQALDEGRYANTGTVYVALDEIDALVLTQLGHKAIGLECSEAVLDQQRFTDLGEEAPHEDILRHTQVAGQEYTILYYPRATGKRKPDALRVGRILSTAGAAKVNLLEVKAGNLKAVAQDAILFTQLENLQTTATERELKSPYNTLRDVLGEDALADPAFDDARGLLIPDKYDIDADGSIWVYDNKGPAVNGVVAIQRNLVTRTLILPSARVVGVESNEQSMMLVYQSGGRWRTKHVAMGVITRRASIATLATWGVHASDHNGQALIGWIHDFIEVNDQHQRFKVIDGYRRTGWHKRDDGTHVFAYPGLTQGVFDMPSGGGADDGLLYHFKVREEVRGTLERQCEAIRRAMSLPQGRVLVTAAFTATLLERLPGERTRLIHCYGDTTNGKTLLSFVPLSVFGPPDKTFVTGVTTVAGLEGYLHGLSGLPVLLDETTTLDEEAASTMIYTACNGVSKLRGTKSGGTQATRTWRNFLLTTGERPLAAKAEHQGANARALNLRMPPLAPAIIEELSVLVNENFGHIIRLWQPYLHTLDYEEVAARAVRYLNEGRAKARELKLNNRAFDTISIERVGDYYMRPLFEQAFNMPKDDGMGLLAVLEGEDFLAVEIIPAHERALQQLQSFVITHPHLIGLENDPDPENRNMQIAWVRPQDGSLIFERMWVNGYLQKEGFNPPSIRKEWVGAGIATETQLTHGTRRPRYLVFGPGPFDIALPSTAGHTAGDKVDDAGGTEVKVH